MNRYRFAVIACILTTCFACTKEKDSHLPPSPIMGASGQPNMLPGQSQNPHRPVVSAKIRGRITVAPKLANKIGPRETMFIIVRNEKMGPPAAVRKVVAPQFPIEYEIGAEDSMIGDHGMALTQAKALSITVRIAKSGTAMPRKGDLEGIYDGKPVKLGDSDVHVTINQERSK